MDTEEKTVVPNINLARVISNLQSLHHSSLYYEVIAVIHASKDQNYNIPYFACGEKFDTSVVGIHTPHPHSTCK